MWQRVRRVVQFVEPVLSRVVDVRVLTDELTQHGRDVERVVDVEVVQTVQTPS